MTRTRLADRREADTRVIEHVATDSLGNTINQEFLISVGRSASGAVAEVFIEVPYQQQKFVTALLAKDVATMLSIAFQHGATVDELRSACGRAEVNYMGRTIERPHTLIGTVLDALAEAV